MGKGRSAAQLRLHGIEDRQEGKRAEQEKDFFIHIKNMGVCHPDKRRADDGKRSQEGSYLKTHLISQDSANTSKTIKLSASIMV